MKYISLFIYVFSIGTSATNIVFSILDKNIAGILGWFCTICWLIILVLGEIQKFKEQSKMSWRNVMDCYQNKWWGHLDKFVPVVAAAGFKYFNWNGTIYEIKNTSLTESTAVDTGLKAEDLRGN